MWRIPRSFKTLLCLVFLVSLFIIFVITNTQSFRQIIVNNDVPLESSKLNSKDDEDGMAYYDAGGNGNNNKIPNKQNQDTIRDDLLKHNYPLEDHDDNNVAHDDFDGGGFVGQTYDETQDTDIKKNNKIQNGEQKAKKIKQNQPSDIISDITCDVNHGKYILDCKKDENDEVFVPFSFIRKYFEIFGKISETDTNKFIWLHSQVKVFRPKQPYNPRGVFTFFENYNVEVRDRVKCVSGAYGVPVSTQWDPNGYFYPIQIAQFGLSHYSKYIIEGEPTNRIGLENGDTFHGNWISQKNVNMQIISNPDSTNANNNIIEVKPSQSSTNNESFKLAVRNHKSRFLHLSWNMRIKTKTKSISKINVTLTVNVRYEKQLFHLHYTTGDFLIKAKDNNIYHGLGYQSLVKWQHVIRDVGVDVQKGVAQYAKKKATKIIKSKLVIESISITNNNKNGAPFWFDNMTLSMNEHLAQFFQAVDWFVLNQDERGGWPIPVKRKFGSEFYPVLEPGWYSSMAMGHGLSLLSRAYAVTKNKIYSEACTHALESIFENSGEGNKGVKAIFMNQLTWYEEYPTNPSSFVLNGFMYSLLGLYDVWKLQIPGASVKAQSLYEDGLQSLITMLPLFDTGSGTMYDLRHFTVPGITPNLARLDYHLTHINQLLAFATISDNQIFPTTAERWIGYTEGIKAPHN